MPQIVSERFLDFSSNNVFKTLVKNKNIEICLQLLYKFLIYVN